MEWNFIKLKLPPSRLRRATSLKRAATNIQRRNKMLSDFLGASGNRTLQFVKINAHFVGVDAHIDPRPEETLLGTPVGERM